MENKDLRSYAIELGNLVAFCDELYNADGKKIRKVMVDIYRKAENDDEPFDFMIGQAEFYDSGCIKLNLSLFNLGEIMDINGLLYEVSDYLSKKWAH
jgi:hypothetical protein